MIKSLLFIGIKFTVMAMAIILATSPLIAQTLPACSAQFYDADGDGFGWENNASCIVTESSIPAPSFFNRETNNQVELTRIYWDGNTDLANRTIQCDRFHFDDAQQRYAFVDYVIASDSQTSEAAGVSEFRYDHQAIPSSEPFQGWVEGSLKTDADFFVASTRRYPVWTIDDGRYVGNGILSSPYLEYSRRSNGSKSLKRWFNNGDQIDHGFGYWSQRMTGDGYFDCYDPSGADFSPSGQQGVATTSPAPQIEEIIVRVSGDTEEPPEVINVMTGLPVQLIRAEWNYNKDIALKNISCYDMVESDGIYTQNLVFPYEAFHPQIDRESRSTRYWSSFKYNSGLLDLSFDNAYNVPVGISEIFDSAFVEVIEPEPGEATSVRIWYEDGTFAFMRCSAWDHNFQAVDLQPTGSAIANDNNTDTDTTSPDQNTDASSDTQTQTSEPTTTNQDTESSTNTESTVAEIQTPTSGGGAGIPVFFCSYCSQAAEAVYFTRSLCYF